MVKKIDVYGLNHNEINQLRKIAEIRYGKASVSLLAKKLLQEQIMQPETQIHQPNLKESPKNPRLNTRISDQHYDYLQKKSQLQHSSINEIVRDILSEHITENPVLSNDAMQALYQSNYQLLAIGRNINQIARHFNAAMPDSLTNQQLNELLAFLSKHTEKVGKILRKQGRTIRYRPMRDKDFQEMFNQGANDEAIESSNR